MQLQSIHPGANFTGFLPREKKESSQTSKELECLTEAVMTIKADFLSLLKNIPELREKLKRDN